MQKTRSFIIHTLITGVILVVPVSRLLAENSVITSFGDGAPGEVWQADDVRNSAGVNIINSGTHHAAVGAISDVGQVSAQLDWLNFHGSAGNLGGIQFDTLGSGAQKSTLSIVNGSSGLLAASDMLNPTFLATYRWQNNDTVDAGLSLKFGVQSTRWEGGESQAGFAATRSGEASWDLILVFDPTNNGQSSAVDGELYTTTVNSDSKFFLFPQAGSSYWTALGATASTLGIDAGSRTLAEWAALDIDGVAGGETWGDMLFDMGANVSNVQFGMGSGNAGGLTTLDWAQFSFLNDGAVIDFIDASTWSGLTSGIQDFALNSNWSDSRGPSDSQNVVFTENATYKTSVAVDANARSIGVMNGDVTIDIANGKSLTLSRLNNGTLYSASGATLNLTGDGALVASVLEVGGATNLAVKTTLDGGVDAHPQRDGASAATSRYGIAILGGGSLTLEDGAEIAVSQDNLNVGVRVGDSDGIASLTIEEGASLVIGNDTDFVSNGLSSNGFFVAGAWGSTGIVNQTGGNFELYDGSFNLGNQGGFGTYTLSGGTATLWGGLHSLGRNTGNRSAGSGTLNIENGVFSVEGSINNGNASFVIGDRDGSDTDGSGQVYQTAGTLSVGSGSRLYLGGYGNSTYTLEGGTLRVGGSSLQGNYGYATSDYDFNLQGGGIQVVDTDLITSVDVSLNDIDPSSAVTTSTIDTNGLNATLNGRVSGTGALVKSGVGVLALSGANEFATLQIGEGVTEVTSSTTLTGPVAIDDAVVTVDGGSTLELTSTGVLNVLKGQTRIGVGSGDRGILTIDGGLAELGTATGQNGDFARTIIGGSGGTGTLNLQSGSVVIGSGATDSEYGSVRVGLGDGSVGVVNQSGGVFNASNSGSMAIGQGGGTGTYNLSSGTANIGGSKKTYFHVGRGAGSVGNFNLSGDGSVNVGVGSGPDEYAFFFVGSMDSTATGYVRQTGNSILTAEQTLFYIGNDSNATGSYTISDSAQLISRSNHPSSSGDRIRLGSEEGGSGEFTQSDSSLVELQNGGKINILGADSTYNLNGGTLQVGGIDGIRGVGDFNLGGGTLEVIESDLSSSLDLSLKDMDSTENVTISSVNTNGFNMIVSGSINGDGSLRKQGEGTLFLTGSSNARSMSALLLDQGTIKHEEGTTNASLMLIGAESADTNGTFTLSGGIIDMTTDGGALHIGSGGGSNTGILNISDGILNLGDVDDLSTRVDFYAGAFGSTGAGTVNQTGGVVNKVSKDGVFHVGNQSGGTYNLSGGQINISGDNGMVIGRSGAWGVGEGVLNVSGGFVNFTEGTDLQLGGAQDSEPLTGSGVVNQIDGVVSLRDNGNLVIGQRGTGIYNLNGGVLEVGGQLRHGNSGASHFNMGGGTLRVIESALELSSGVNTVLKSGTTSSVDTNNFNATVQGNLSGDGHLVVLGGGVLKINGTNTNTGTTTITAETELSVDGEHSGSELMIAEGALLSGGGVIHAATTVDGTLAAGNSAGLLSFTDDLALGETSVSVFEFNTNTATGRGFSFDSVNMNGGILTIDPSATLSLVFNTADSEVDFANAFWDSDQSWILFDNDEDPILDSIIFAAVNVSADSLGSSFGAEIGSFSVSTLGNDVILNFTAVPEPAAYALLLSIVVGAVVLSRRRRS